MISMEEDTEVSDDEGASEEGAEGGKEGGREGEVVSCHIGE